MSESEAAGKLIKMPGIVEAAAIKPNQTSGVPRLVANGFKTGFFDIVELKIANDPIMHIIKKVLSLAFLVCEAISKPALNTIGFGLLNLRSNKTLVEALS